MKSSGLTFLSCRLLLFIPCSLNPTHNYTCIVGQLIAKISSNWLLQTFQLPRLTRHKTKQKSYIATKTLIPQML